MTTRSTRAALAKLLSVLIAFTLIATACGDDSGSSDDAQTDETPDGDASDGDASDGDSSDGDDDQAESTGGLDDDAGDTAAEDSDIDDVTADEAVSGGTLRISLEAETDGLNPNVNRFAVAAYQMGNAVFEPLVTWDADGFPTPYLASGWESSDDGLTFTMFLREGIKFHDGTDFNADAVIRNFEGQLADTLISLAVKPALDLENPVDKIDDYTVQYNLALPNKQFATGFPSQLGYVASPAWLDAAVVNPALNQEPVGTGPFTFASRTTDLVTRFERNDAWWQTEQLGREVYLDAVEFYPITDSEIAAGQLVAGDLESTGTTNAEAILAMRDEGDALTRLEDDFGEESFAMMNASVPPFDDLRVRQALTFATPIENYLEFAGAGILRSSNSMFAPELIWNNPDVVQEGDVPDQAAPLIEAYCADVPENCDGGKVNIDFQYSGPSVIQEQIADILTNGWSPYFNVEREVVLQDALITNVALGAYEVVTWRQFGSPDPTSDRVWLACDSISVLSLNWPRFCDEDREALLNAVRATDDLDERIAGWQELQQMIHDDYLYVFFTQTLWVNAFQANVKNQCGAVSPDDVALLCTVNGRHWTHQMWME